jgi:hypothetical protein
MILHPFAQEHQPNREARLCPGVPTQILASGENATGCRPLNNGIAKPKRWFGKTATRYPRTFRAEATSFEPE